MSDFKVDTSKLDRLMPQYLATTSKTITDGVNTTCYFLARDAVAETQGTSKDDIYRSLMKSSDISSTASIANILVNVQRGKQGQPGLNGQQMTVATDKLVRKRQATRNWLRSGWIKAVKAFGLVIPTKAGQPPMPAGIRQKGQNTGLAITAKNGWSPKGILGNLIYGDKTHPPKVMSILKEGLQKAINRETESKMKYLLSKGIDVNNRKFNRA